MKKRLIMLCISVIFALPSLGTAGVIVNETIIVPFFLFVPCAVDGAGEDVFAELRLHIVMVQTLDANGGLHLKIIEHPQGGMGEGLTTGDIYRVTGMTGEQITVAGGGLPFTNTFVNNFRWIGPGRDNNYLVHQTIHLTVNANGEVTADLDNSSVECK